MDTNKRSLDGKGYHGLSDTSLVVLAHAAARENRMVLPLPDKIRLHGGARDKLLRKLLRLGFVENTPVPDPEHAWWTRDDGSRVGVRVAAKGLQALGIETSEPEAEPPASEDPETCSPTADGEGSSEAIRDEAHVQGRLVGKKGETERSFPVKVRPGSKQALLIERLSSGEGCTLDELARVLSWQRHTVRAALTDLRQKGFRVTKSKSDEGETRYHAFAWPDAGSR